MKAKLNELESESDIFPQNEGQSYQIWIGHFQWALTTSAMMEHGINNSALSMKDFSSETDKRKKSNRCNQRSYNSPHLSDMKNHLKIHSKEKTNTCSQCNFSSSWANSLKAHLKMHSGDKLNKCNQCDYASSAASNLRTHLKTHSAEKQN